MVGNWWAETATALEKWPFYSGIGRLVRKGGLEPPRYCYRQPLKLVRLPIPPLPQVVGPIRLSSDNCATLSAPPVPGPQPVLRGEPQASVLAEPPAPARRPEQEVVRCC